MPGRNRLLLRALQFAPLMLFVVVFVLFGLISPRFFAWQNLENILRQASYIGTIATGLTFVLLTAGIDLSVGAVMYLSAIVVGVLLGMDVPLWLALVAGLMTGAVFGLLNALLITRLKIIAFIATLATLTIGRGVGLAATGSRGINFPDAILELDSYRVFGLIPAPIVLFAVVVVVAQLVLGRTGYGRQIYALGNDLEAARKGGLAVDRLLASVYVTSGVLASLGGLISISQIGVVNSGFGEGVEFSAIAAAVLGGTSLFGGRGSVFPGTVLGAVLIQTIASGLIFARVDLYLQPIVTAGIIFLAVLLDSIRNGTVQRLERRAIRVEG